MTNPEVSATPVTAQTIMDRVEERYADGWRLPPFTPHLGRQVEVVAFREDISWDEALQLVRQDPMLVALVLREASRLDPHPSLEAALEALKPAGVRELLQRVAHGAERLRDPDVIAWMTETQHHAWRLGRAAGEIARSASLDVDRVQTAAELSDVGLLVGLSVIADGWSVRNQPGQVMDLLAAGQHTLGWYLADAWKLPVEVQLTIANGSTLEIAGEPHPHLAVIRLARCLLRDIGLGLQLPGLREHVAHPIELVEALRTLDLDQARLLALRDQMRATLLG